MGRGNCRENPGLCGGSSTKIKMELIIIIIIIIIIMQSTVRIAGKKLKYWRSQLQNSSILRLVHFLKYHSPPCHSVNTFVHNNQEDCVVPQFSGDHKIIPCIPFEQCPEFHQVDAFGCPSCIRIDCKPMQERYTSAQKSIQMSTASLILNDNYTL